jgi:acyl transferase domain-containing protein
VLTYPVQEMVEDLDGAVVLSSTRRDRGEAEAVLDSLAQLHVRGGSVDWQSLFGGRRRVELPTYAFDRQRYWLSSSHTAVTVELPTTDRAPGEGTPVSLPELLTGRSGADAEAIVLGHVLDRAAAVLGHASADVLDPDGEFRQFGFDSLLSVELSKRLAASTGLKLRANLVLRHPSPRLIARHILSTMAEGGAA